MAVFVDIGELLVQFIFLLKLPLVSLVGVIIELSRSISLFSISVSVFLSCWIDPFGQWNADEKLNPVAG